MAVPTSTEIPPACSSRVRADRGGPWPGRIFWCAVALVLLPLLVSAVHVAGARFNDVGDFAGIEMRTRDVGHHPVLLGLWSRTNWNHPGPALFYLLALPYRLAGSRASGLQLGALVINGAALLGMAIVARRRGGLALALLTLLACGALFRALGPEFVSSPWNPWMPVLPFGLLVLLCWSVACGDAWALPVAAGVASFCVQTHVGYLPVAVPLCAVAAASLGWQARRATVGERPSAVPQRRTLLRASGVTGIVLGLMWLPPVLDQILHRPGNMLRVFRYFRQPGQNVATLGDGYRTVVGQFGLRPSWFGQNHKLVASALEPAMLRSTPVPVLLVLLVGAGVVAWRRRRVDAAWLAVTIVVTAALGIIAVARTIRPVYGYRLGWTWVLGALGFVAVIWTAWLLLEPRYRQADKRRIAVVPLVALLILGVVNVSDALHAAPPLKNESDMLDELLPATVAALPSRPGDVLVKPADTPAVLYQGMQLALERRGIRARTDDPTDIVGNGSEHRVHRRGAVRAVLTVATDANVEATITHPGEHLVAYWGPVSAQQRVQIALARLTLRRKFRAGAMSGREVFLQTLVVSRPLHGPEVAISMRDPSARDAALRAP